MESKQRITATEREALMRLNLAYNFLLESPENLTRRTKMIDRGAFYLASARKMMEQYIKSAYRTIPTEQLKIIQRSIKETSYTVGVKCPATANARRFEEWGVIVPIAAINELFTACGDHCITCMGDTEAQAKCELRKALDMIPNDTEERSDGGCPYRALM